MRLRLKLVKWLLLLLPALGGTLEAAIIRGAVVENLTGKPLSRAQVTAQPIGSGGPAVRVSTNPSGSFEITTLRAGAYIVTASRQNFAPVQYGQKDFRSAGLPVILEDVSSTFLNFRLPRLAAISGRVVDENDVGLPNHDLAIYRNAHPPELIRRMQADERGAYRFYGLDPGSYLLRTVAREYEEGSYLPTFSKDNTTVEEARAVEVNLDQEIANFDVRPKQGRLYKMEGTVLPGLPTATGEPVTVRLTRASEMGRDQMETNRGFRFPAAAPGDYELYAEGPGDGSSNCFILGGYLPVPVKDRDFTDIRMPVPCVRETPVSFYEKRGERIEPQKVQLLARRKDLAGPGETRLLRVSVDRVQLPPGRWELMVKPPANYCVVAFSYGGPRTDGAERSRPDGWNEVSAGSGSGALRFTLSASPGAMHGLVSGLAHEPLSGAPVYLEGYDADSHKRVGDLQMGLTDARGNYQFRGLAPGSYRLLASYEFQHPDTATMEYAGAKLVKVEEGMDAPQDLELSVLR
ncbi:MAG: carboxypeptidase-like regulatory domain-containing protein [Candidatus Sulfopaludibacter sp.]|nr:carboxypeptidase-like regulatory domain-containing protein [Candidatus Sulfopaludibacter sp.]